MKTRTWPLAVVLCICVSGTRTGAAPATAPAAQDDATSKRLTFLTLQLSSAEESIKAINAAMRAAGYKAVVAGNRAEGYEKGNEIMDRKGGAPVPWDEFYGKTAKKFLVTDGRGRGVYQVPRPPQMDYLYRANNEQAAKAKDEIAAMGRKIDSLLARRRQLEGEQVSLWGMLALESMGSREIPFRPLYRLRLKVDAGKATTPATDEARVAFLRSAILFLRLSDRAAAQAAENISDNRDSAIKSLTGTIQPAEATFREAAFGPMQAAAATPAEMQQLKDLLALGKQIRQLCKNVSDAYRLAQDSEANNDDARKLTFRGALQESLLDLANAMGEFDDAVVKLAALWNISGEAGVDSPDKLPAATATPVDVPRATVIEPPPPPAASSAAVTVTCSDKVKVLALEPSAPRLYDSNPLRVIEGLDPAVKNLQFISIPQRLVISYSVRVNKPCTLYAFGSKKTDPKEVFGDDRSKWEPAGKVIQGTHVDFVLRRNVTAGDHFTVRGFEVELAAESIELTPTAGRADSRSDLNPADWRVWCWSGQKWDEYPLDKMSVHADEGVLRVKNTSDVRWPRAILVYRGALLDGDFSATAEYRGQIESFDFQSAAGDNKYVNCPQVPADDRWHSITLKQSGKSVTALVEDTPTATKVSHDGAPAKGYFAIKLRPDDTVEIRSFRLNGGSSGRADAVRTPEPQDPAPQRPESVSLFDGKTLAGWDADPHFWSVSDGAIKGKSTDGKTQSLLCTAVTFENFVFDVDFRFVSGNSGIFFRGDAAANFGYRGGYEADIYLPNAMGKLARGAETLQRPDTNLQNDVYRPGEWNHYQVEARGDQIRLTINGHLMASLIHHAPHRGPIGLQLEGRTEVYFRDLQVHVLP